MTIRRTLTTLILAAAVTVPAVAPAAIAAPGATPGARVAEWAAAQVGVSETPAGSNRTPYGPAGAPWAGYFTGAAFAHAGIRIPGRGAAVAATVAWAQRSGRYLPAGGRPRPGDLVIYRGAGHAGVIVAVRGHGALTAITTVEGNVSDRVVRRGPLRVSSASSRVAGYVRARR